MKECPSCKAKNKNDAAFCGECGTSLEGVSVTADEWVAAAGACSDSAGYLRKGIPVHDIRRRGSHYGAVQ